MRKALAVGINYYERLSPLYGCVNDAQAVKTVLERHSDRKKNFDVKLLAASEAAGRITRAELKKNIRGLFSGNAEVALFYFAGHGHIEDTGGYLVASDAESGDDGLPLSEVLTLANQSVDKIENRVILLDSCHAGVAGASAQDPMTAELKEGTTILTASTAKQYATEANGSGIFTTLLVDALNGAAANLVGDVTPGSVYAHIDQSLGSWEDQRPMFKTNVQSFVSLRQTSPSIGLDELVMLTKLFPSADAEFDLDPSFEPEKKGRDAGMPPPKPANTKRFAILQKYNRVNLVVPVDAPHMWHAAMQSKSCRLTLLGKHYWRLVKEERI